MAKHARCEKKWFERYEERRSAFEQNIPGNFPTGTKWFLRFSIKLRLHAPGIAKGQDKLILPLPPGFLSGAKQGLLGTAPVDLYNDPTEFCCLKIQHQLLFCVG